MINVLCCCLTGLRHHPSHPHRLQARWPSRCHLLSDPFSTFVTPIDCAGGHDRIETLQMGTDEVVTYQG
jgi:hypothetical protein